MTTPTFTITQDTREQTPYSFTTTGHAVEVATLAAGDYSIKGLTDFVAFERKELSDFIGCCTGERDRFKRELHRLSAYRYRAVIIEASLADIAAHRYRSTVAPEAVLGSLASWSIRYETPFLLCGDRTHGERMTLALLRNAHAQMADLVKAVTCGG